MPWSIASAPSAVTVHMGENFLELIAVRIDTDSGVTELLVSNYNTPPQWIPFDEVVGLSVAKPS